MVTAALVSAGYRVLKPITVERYDLMTDGDKGLRRVQIKTGKLEHGSVRVRAMSVNYDKCSAKRYVGQADDIAAYCPQNGNVYLVPMDVVGERYEVYLRVDPTGNNQTKGILWATDFVL